MSVQNRLENAFAGYVLLDVWKFLADRECRRRALPRGSLWMACQTHKNLQFVVMGLVASLVGKDSLGNPFRHGHHRWSELPIEEYFGRLRMRAHNSQFNAKQFWSAASAEMIGVSKQGMGQTDTSRLDPPSEEEIYNASARGFQAAVSLAAWTAGVSHESLEAAYRKTAGGLILPGDFEVPLHEWERDEQEDWEEDDAEAEESDLNAGAKWKQLLGQTRADAAAPVGDTEDKENNEPAAPVGETEDKENNEPAVPVGDT